MPGARRQAEYQRRRSGPFSRRHAAARARRRDSDVPSTSGADRVHSPGATPRPGPETQICQICRAGSLGQMLMISSAVQLSAFWVSCHQVFLQVGSLLSYKWNQNSQAKLSQ
jgi:hypothetical protein